MPRPSHTRSNAEPMPDPRIRAVVMGIAIGAGLIGLGSLLFASLPLKIAGLVFMLAVLQGLWRGGAEIAGLVVGLVLATLLAPSLGRSFEGLTGGMLGTTGLTNRFISVCIVAAVITTAGAAVTGIFTKRAMRAHPNWKPWNRIAGGSLGGVEGVLLAMIVLWAPLALAPIAQSRLSAESAEPEVLASTIVRLSKQVGASPFGEMARATNPFSESELFALAEDFAQVSRDRAAMEYFLATPVMVAVAELPSVTTGIEQVKQDRTLAPLFEQGAATVGSMRAVLDSPTLLRILDETTVVSDLSPRLSDIAQAIRDAKARIGTPPPPPD